MSDYFRKGWLGQLRFSEVFWGSGGEFMLEGGLAYIGFYLLLITSLFTYQSVSFGALFGVLFGLYGLAYYIWFLKALWGSANHCSSAISAGLIRFFTVLLPLISVALFILVIIYYLVNALFEFFIDQ